MSKYFVFEGEHSNFAEKITMSNAIFTLPEVLNDPNKMYEPGSTEREGLKKEIEKCYSEVREIKMCINGKYVSSNEPIDIFPPHRNKHKIGTYYQGNDKHVDEAIDTALAAREKWAAMPWEMRLSIFRKAADLISGPYRAKINAATMVGQSKNAFQAEIDAASELIDFLRFNAEYAEEIYTEQPYSPDNTWNRVEYRPLEGFIWAVTPFNFTAIAGNLPSAPAMLGNVVVWKPSDKQIYSSQVVMEVFKEAGLPDGVINMIFTDPVMTSEKVFSHPDFAGVHFTGSTKVFRAMWTKIGENINTYKTYPRIVGETGGKDFIFAHPTAAVDPLVVAMARGAFEFQGQKCSAASRAYVPKSMWPDVRKKLTDMVNSFKIGDVADFSNFINAVIDEKAFDKIAAYIDRAKEASDAEVIIGGDYDKSEGYFVKPTVILTDNPKYESMCEEIFGPVLTIYTYDDEKVNETLELLDNTSEYALTGAIFSQDRYAIDMMTKKLVNSAGNFYINDKPTGAVVNQQPFGGARASGTNDKAGSKLNMYRWLSMRTIKENFVPPVDYRYPFMEKE